MPRLCLPSLRSSRHPVTRNPERDSFGRAAFQATNAIHIFISIDKRFERVEIFNKKSFNRRCDKCNFFFTTRGKRASEVENRNFLNRHSPQDKNRQKQKLRIFEFREIRAAPVENERAAVKPSTSVSWMFGQLIVQKSKQISWPVCMCVCA